MKEWDPSGKQGPKQPMPDLVTVLQPKDEEPISDKPTIGARLCAAGGHALHACTFPVILRSYVSRENWTSGLKKFQ